MNIVNGKWLYKLYIKFYNVVCHFDIGKEHSRRIMLEGEDKMRRTAVGCCGTKHIKDKVLYIYCMELYLGGF